MVLKSFASSAR